MRDNDRRASGTRGGHERDRRPRRLVPHRAAGGDVANVRPLAPSRYRAATPLTLHSLRAGARGRGAGGEVLARTRRGVLVEELLPERSRGACSATTSAPPGAAPPCAALRSRSFARSRPASSRPRRGPRTRRRRRRRPRPRRSGSPAVLEPRLDAEQAPPCRPPVYSQRRALTRRRVSRLPGAIDAADARRDCDSFDRLIPRLALRLADRHETRVARAPGSRLDPRKPIWKSTKCLGFSILCH